jgi:hypothetical protein
MSQLVRVWAGGYDKPWEHPRESSPQVVENSVEKFIPPVGKFKKVLSYKGIFPFTAGCGKIRGKPPKNSTAPVEKSPKNP